MDEFQARRLVDAYADMILRISYQYLKQTHDAEDICQTVFLKYLTRAPKFNDFAHEKAWIIRTAINACKDVLKSAHRRKTVPLENASYLAAPEIPDNDLMDALKLLPENYRISLYLHYYEGYSALEIGDILGKRESTITVTLSRARKKLRTILEAERRRIV